MIFNNETLELEVREMTKEITDLVNPNEFESFAELLTKLCEFLLNELDTDNSPLLQIKKEFLLMPFWANTAIIYLRKRNKKIKKSKYHNLIFAICKMI